MRETVRQAIRYWEPRRLIYNLVLAAVVAVWLVATWPHFRNAATLESLGRVTVLALAANVCYCAAYFVDILMQRCSFDVNWRRWRWALWLLGTILAIALENYWIVDEIYPSVH